MQQKLKSVFRRSSKSRSSSGPHEQLGSTTHHGEASLPPAVHQSLSSDRHGSTSVDSNATGPAYTGRSRPVSSVDDDRRQSQASAKYTSANGFASPADFNGGAIANDYKAYLPALSPVTDDQGDACKNLSGDRRHIIGASEARHEGNIPRYSSSIESENYNSVSGEHVGSAVASSATPLSNLPSAQVHSRNQSAGARSVGPVPSSVYNGGSLGNTAPSANITTTGDLVDGFHVTSVHENSRTAGGEETALARRLREAGVADLRNTVDTDGDIKWVPAVTHEVIKPYRHEIIQQKIYREIHNYEHFHRIQPVTMTEVLPPRHWIPNPTGEGLIEISADELPARTGDNRWWSICEHSSPYSRQTALPRYRTEPEIIEAGTFMTEQGFERKETIIIHPPTLADLTGYGGPVQAMHFDHKTGKSWMGELTTMDKLHELQQELNRAPVASAFEMGGLGKALPKLPSNSTGGGHNSESMPSRKPVSSHSSIAIPSNVHQRLDAA